MITQALKSVTQVYKLNELKLAESTKTVNETLLIFARKTLLNFESFWN